MILHITSGDIAGGILKRSGVAGEVFVWHDILYDGPTRSPGWPDGEALEARAAFLEAATGGGLTRQTVLETLRGQYAVLARTGDYESVVLWFDACLFDQSMLCHILACLKLGSIGTPQLLCVDSFPGIEPYDGLGQLEPGQLASLYPGRRPVTDEQFRFAEEVDRAFALQDMAAFAKLAGQRGAPLPWVPAAVTRWLQEQPNQATGLGRLEQLTLDAVRNGCSTPAEIFRFAQSHDSHPLYWGDITLWAKINGLAAREPPLVRLEGPKSVLPQWDDRETLEAFRVYPL